MSVELQLTWIYLERWWNRWNNTNRSSKPWQCWNLVNEEWIADIIWSCCEFRPLVVWSLKMVHESKPFFKISSIFWSLKLVHKSKCISFQIYFRRFSQATWGFLCNVNQWFCPYTVGRYPKLPQTTKKKEFLHKLLVKHPGYLPGVCGWDLRVKNQMPLGLSRLVTPWETWHCDKLLQGASNGHGSLAISQRFSPFGFWIPNKKSS